MSQIENRRQIGIAPLTDEYGGRRTRAPLREMKPAGPRPASALLP